MKNTDIIFTDKNLNKDSKNQLSLIFDNARHKLFDIINQRKGLKAAEDTKIYVGTEDEIAEATGGGGGGGGGIDITGKAYALVDYEEEYNGGGSNYFTLLYDETVVTDDSPDVDVYVRNESGEYELSDGIPGLVVRGTYMGTDLEGHGIMSIRLTVDQESYDSPAGTYWFGVSKNSAKVDNTSFEEENSFTLYFSD